MHQSVSDRLPQVWSKDDMKYIAEERAKQLRDNFGWQNAGVYDPQSVGGTHVIYVLHDATDPERYSLPKNPTIPWSYNGVEVAVQARARHVRAVRFSRRDRALHHLRPARGATGTSGEGGPRCRHQRLARSNGLTTKPANAFEHAGKTTVYRGELLRHPVYTRVLHWAVALFFFLALFTGFGIYLPWLFRWFTPFLAADRSAASCIRISAWASSFASDCKP